MKIGKVNPMLINFFLFKLESVAARQDGKVPPSLGFSKFKNSALGNAALALRGSLRGGVRERYRRKNGR
jgi:hypothetical protein